MSELTKIVAGVAGNCLMWRKTSKHLVTRSVRNEAFCVSGKGDSEEKHSRKKLTFSLHREQNTEFFLYRHRHIHIPIVCKQGTDNTETLDQGINGSCSIMGAIHVAPTWILAGQMEPRAMIGQD